MTREEKIRKVIDYLQIIPKISKAFNKLIAELQEVASYNTCVQLEKKIKEELEPKILNNIIQYVDTFMVEASLDKLLAFFTEADNYLQCILSLQIGCDNLIDQADQILFECIQQTLHDQN